MIDRGHPIRRGRTAFTLVEVLVAVAIMAILLGAVGSAIVITSRAVDHADSPSAHAREAAETLSDMASALRLAVDFDEGELTSTAVEFTLPGSGRSREVIRYEWSGPETRTLTRQRDEGVPIVVAEDVTHFNLLYHETTIAGTGGTDEMAEAADLDVLFVVRKDTDLRDDEVVRKFLLEAWGWSVTVIDDEVSQSEFDDALALHDVVYLPDTFDENKVEDKLNGSTIGVVIEHRQMTDVMLLSEKEFQTQNGTSLLISDNTHYITQNFFPGLLPIMTDNNSLHYSRDPLASGAVVLAHQIDDATRLMLVTIETGATLFNGDPAAGRRVIMPWGDSLELERLNDHGRTVLRRSFEWAANAEVIEEVGVPLFAQFPDPGASDKDYEVKSDHWAVASLIPDLPPEATGWRVTRFRFMARQKEVPDETVVVQIRGRDPLGEPTELVYGQTTIAESLLPFEIFDWVEVEFSMDDPIPAGEGACFAIGCNINEKAAEVYYQDGIGESTPSNQFWWNEPGDWKTNVGHDMPCEVDGVIETDP